MPLALTLATHAHPAVRAGVPALAQACGWLAGAIGIVTGWPQVWRLWGGRRHEGLSLTSNVLAVLYVSAWLMYGYEKHSVVMVPTNVLGLVVIVVILAGHLRLARPAVRQWLPLLISGLVVLGVVSSIGARTLGITASAATISGVAPQVLLLARARLAGRTNATGVSRQRWALSCAANLLWMAYGGLGHDPVLFFNSLVIAAFSAAIVLLAAPVRRADELALPFQADYAVAA